MDILLRSMLFGGKAVVTAIDCTETTEKARKIHGLSKSATNALARVLAMGVFMSAGFKGLKHKLTLIIDGDGAGGNIIVCGDCGSKVRCRMDNPDCFAGEDIRPVREVIGGDGRLTVIKDFGLKEPYNGTVKLVNGSVDADFAYYFTTSEQLPSAIATGVRLNEDGNVKAAGAVIVQPMPGCPSEIVETLADVVRNFKDMDDIVEKHTPSTLIEEYFGHFEIKALQPTYPAYVCSCSREAMERILVSIGKKDALDIIKENGKIEFHCDFCHKTQEFTKEDVEKIFEEADDKNNRSDTQ